METQNQYRKAVEPPAATFQSASVPARAIFRQEGEYWTVGCSGNTFRLKDTKGLGYLAHLLRHPGVEFHVLDLASGIGGRRDAGETTPSGDDLPHGDEDLDKAGIHIASLGDAGEMLDEQAKVDYRRRLSELREELEEAKELGNVERAEKTEQEIEALTTELSRAVGLGGRSRRAASASERARQSIAKTIKSVVERIVQSDARLGEIFSRCIRTGNFCSYEPDPEFPIAWEFDEATIEPAKNPASSGEHAPEHSEHPQISPAALEVSPFSFTERTAFAGRESERSTIRAAVDRALAGRGSIVMLAGGAGVGKTRLAMEMAEYASGVGFRCRVGHCYERDEAFPFLPFAEIIEGGVAEADPDDFRRWVGDNAAELAQIAPSLRRIFHDIPQPLELPPAQKRRHLFQSVSDTTARAAQLRPQLYILEDLHWGDESSLALLIHLANRVALLPVVIIGTYRDGYTENNHPLVRTLEELIRMGVRPLKLGGLTEDAIAQMLHGMSQRRVPETLVRLIFEESQGYPFFVEEVYRHLIEEGRIFDEAGQFRTDIEIAETEVPESVRLIIGRRLKRLDADEMRALATAAVIGRRFSFELLSAICEKGVDELLSVIEKAQQMGIIVPSAEGQGTQFSFAHELVRQTLLAGISAPRQQQLHARVADKIEALYHDTVNERAGEIADHLLKAESFADSERLLHYLTLAGKSALDAAAFEEAQRNFKSALSQPGAVDAAERAGLLADLAMADSGLERWQPALANLRESLEIYIGLGNREMIGSSFSELTDVLIFAGHFQEAIEAARRGLAYLEGDVSVDRVRLLDALSQALAWAEGYEPAQEALKEALQLASQLSDPKLMGRLVGVRSIINFHFFQLREAVEDGFLSERLSGSDVSPWQRAVQQRALCAALAYLGRAKETARVASELEPFARKIGQSFPIALCRTINAWAEFGKAPDLAKLETNLQQVLKFEQSAQFAFWVVISEAQLSLVDFYRGNWAEALWHAHASCRAEPGSSSEGVGIGTLFRQMAYAGDRIGALASLSDRFAWMPRLGQRNPRGSWSMLALVIEGFAILGERSRTAELYPLARELLATGAVALWPVSRLTQTVAGVAAAAAHEWEAAEDHFQTALEQAESFPNRLEQAEIHRFHAMMLIDRAAPGDRKMAKVLFGGALETYTRIGMARHSEVTEALMRGA